MKRTKTFFLLAALVIFAMVVSSCKSRQPHCPGVYSKATPIEKPVQF